MLEKVPEYLESLAAFEQKKADAGLFMSAEQAQTVAEQCNAFGKEKENHYLINKESLAEMKDGVVIINTARGALIESEALIAGIESGKVGAAALDVVEKEFGLYYYDRKSDVLDNRELAILRGFPNVTVSHHMAFYTDNYTRTVVRDSLQSCKLFMEGKKNPWEVC